MRREATSSSGALPYLGGLLLSLAYHVNEVITACDGADACSGGLCGARPTSPSPRVTVSEVRHVALASHVPPPHHWRLLAFACWIRLVSRVLCI